MNVFVIDDHPMMREAIVMVFRRLRPAANLVELDRLDALGAAVKRVGPPDLICLDLNLPDTHGDSGVLAVKAAYPLVPLAVYSASPAEDMEALCIGAGADIYIEKAAGAPELMAALKGLLQADEDDDDVPVAANTKLSKRQTELIGLLSRGLSNREMAEELAISEHTIKVHLWRLFRRIGVGSRTQALHWARTSGLLARPPVG